MSSGSLPAVYPLVGFLHRIFIEVTSGSLCLGMSF